METLMWKQAVSAGLRTAGSNSGVFRAAAPKGVQRAASYASWYAKQTSGGMGGVGSVIGGMVMGGVGGYWGGDGTAGDFIGGALMGGLGGAALSRAAASNAFSGMRRFAQKKMGAQVGAYGSRVAGAMQNKANRAALFGSGAFLTGTAFGAMFGHPRANRKRGFNQHRGNRF